MDEYARMDTAKPLKLITIFSIPAIFAMVFESLAIVIDMAFIGHIPRNGTPALSAMGLMNPIFLFLGALQILTAVSASILVAKYWGQQQKDEVYAVIAHGIYLTCLINVAIMFLIFMFRIPLLKYLGASGQVLFLANQYVSIYVFSQIFGALGFLFISIIRASGYPRVEIVVVVLATISNLLLDALFIVGFQWGISGEAWATLLSDGFYFLLSLRYILQKLLRLPFMDGKPGRRRDITLRLLQIGFVPFFMQVLISVSNLLTNRMLLIYGSALSVAIMAVILNIFLTLIMPLFGLGQGIQPLFAYFYGAQQNHKMLSILKTSLILSILYGLLIYLTVFFFGKQLAGIFSADQSLTALIHDGLKIYFLSFFPGAGYLFCYQCLLSIYWQRNNSTGYKFDAAGNTFYTTFAAASFIVDTFESGYSSSGNRDFSGSTPGRFYYADTGGHGMEALLWWQTAADGTVKKYHAWIEIISKIITPVFRI